MTRRESTRFSLTEGIDAQLSALEARSALCARHVPSQQEVAIRADEPVHSLSVIKIPIMVLAYRDADAGFLNLDERYTIGAGDLRRSTGLLWTFDLGLQPTYRDLITQMIITSDNTATDILIKRLRLERVNEMLAELGYADTRLRMTTGELFRRISALADPANTELSDEEVYARGFPGGADMQHKYFDFAGDPAQWFGRTTARETARLLEQLVQGQLASDQSTAAMERTLQWQFFNSRLPQRIQGRVGIGHKTGDWPPIVGNDVGVLYGRGGPIVIALFITHNRGRFVDLEAAHGAIAETILDEWEDPTGS